MVEFDYRQERTRSGEIAFRLVVKVSLLRGQAEWIAEFFYVDSGADYTLIPYALGRFLGLAERASGTEEMTGIAGVVGVRFAVVPMKIDKYQFDCRIAWAQIESIPLLLGRENVFDYFDITFQQRKKKTLFDWQQGIKSA